MCKTHAGGLVGSLCDFSSAVSSGSGGAGWTQTFLVLAWMNWAPAWT